MRKRFNKPFKAIALTVAVSVFWLDAVWALDPRQKLLDDAEKLLAMQADGPRAAAPELTDSFTALNTSNVAAQNDLQGLMDQNAAGASDSPAAEPRLTLKTSAGDLLDMENGAVARVTRADGTVLTGLEFDADGRITGADLLLNDGTIQVVQGGAAVAAKLPDGTQVFYNAAGRVEKAVTPDQKEIGYTYLIDAQGAVLKTTVTTADSVSEYDTQGKILQTVFASGKKIVYADGRIDRIENGGAVYRYVSTVEGGLTRAVLSHVEDAVGNRYEFDAAGAVAAVLMPDGTRIQGIRWQAGSISDARVTRPSGDVHEYAGSKLVRHISVEGVETTYAYNADRIVASSQGRFVEYLLSTGDAAKITLADGTTIDYLLQGTYKGYPFQAAASDGSVAVFDYSKDASGKTVAIKKEAVSAALQQTVIYASTAAVAYTTNPSLTFTAAFNPQSPDTRVQAQAANTASANIVLDLVPGTGSTWKFGTAAAVPLGLTLDASKTYTGEIRWETSGIGIYVYEKGLPRPAAPLTRIASRNWNVKFVLTATDADVQSYLPSSGTFTRTVQTADKTAAQIPARPIHRTIFKFDAANAANQIKLTAVQAAAGTAQETFTFTWLSGRWTLVKSSKNTLTGAVTTATAYFSQTLAAGKEYAAELRIESGKINLYVHETALAKPAAATMSSVVLIDSAAFTSAATNASLRTETFRNTAVLSPAELAAYAKGYPFRTVASDGMVTFFEYALDAAGKLTAIKMEAVNAPLKTTTAFASSAAISYTANPSLTFTAAFNPQSPDTRVQAQAANTASANIVLDLVPGTGSTWKFGTAAAVPLGLTLDAAKAYTGEIRWETSGIGIYVYEKGLPRPAAPLTRIAAKTWSPRFSLTAVDTSVSAYVPSAGTFIKTVKTEDKTASQIPGSPVHRTLFRFDNANTANQVQLTAIQPVSGTMQNTFTLTWRSGRWTLVKSSKNTLTGAVTNTTATFAQALAAGKEYAAELRLESGKLNLYVYETALAKPIAATMSTAVLTSTAAFTSAFTNAAGRTETYRNTGPADLSVFANPAVVNDSAVRPLLTALDPAAAAAVNAPDLTAVDYETSTGKITRTVQKDGTVAEFAGGLLKSVNSQGTLTNFLMEASAYGNLSSLTMERAGLKTAYDAKGKLKSVASRGADGLDQTVFYGDDHKVIRIEKSDGTRIEELTFDAAGSAIRGAVVRTADGAVRRYAAGRIVEERKADGTVTSFADGRPSESRMADGRIYVYSVAAAVGTAPVDAGYTMILKQYRTDTDETVELDTATGLPVRITRANGDIATGLVFDAAGNLTDYSLETRDAQGTAWTLTFVAGELARAADASGKKAFYENNRLMLITEPGKPDVSLSYGLDVAGKAVTTRVVKGAETRVYDASGQLMHFEADGLTADYDDRGIAAISDGVSSYVRPVFAADGTLSSGQIRTGNGTTYVIGGGKLAKILRPDGVEVGFDPSGYVTSILDGAGQTTFDYIRDPSGVIQDIRTTLAGGAPGGLTDFLQNGTNPGYWPVKGQGGWNALTKYNDSFPSYAKFADGSHESIYNSRPESDLASNVYLRSTSLRATADRTGAIFYFDDLKMITVRQGGFVYVKFRIKDAPALTSVRIRPSFGWSGGLDDLARELSVSDGVVTALIPITRATNTPVDTIAFDFVPPQKSADTWTLAVEQAGYFELATTQSNVYEPALFLAADSRNLIAAQPAVARIPSAAAWTAKSFSYDRVKSFGDTPVRMTLGANGEALDSVIADGVSTVYADGRAERVTSPDGTVTEYAYDADGKVSEMSTRPAGGALTTTRYAYGRIREVAAENGSIIYRYSYEFEGNREFMLIADARTGEVKRYSDGRLLSSVDAEGLLTAYTYAGSAADSRIASSVVTWKGQPLSRFTYSYAGSETRITDTSGLTKIYDPSGKLTFIQTVDGLRYRKNALTDESGAAVEEDALYSAETADGVTLFYKNDTVEKIVLKDGSVINVAADQNLYRNVLLREGLVDEVTREDGSTAKYLRDEIGRLTFVDLTRDGRIYRYDADGALVRITDPAARKISDFGFRRDEEGRIVNTRVIERVWSPVGALNLPVVLRAASYGYVDGWNSSITVDGVDHSDFNLNIEAENREYRGRGWSVAHVNASGKVINKGFFDVYYKGSDESDRMAAFLEAIPAGDAVIMAVADEGAKNLTDRAMKAIKSFGSVRIDGLAYRDSFALIGQKGAPAGSAVESLVRSGSDTAAFASNASTQIYYYDEAGKPITYDQFAASPSLSWGAYHSFEAEPELEVFASNENGASGWRKNFDPAHPDSGFVYLWDGMSINDQITPIFESNPQNKSDYVALTSHVPPSGRYVYYDPQYPTANTYGFTGSMLTYLTSLGYQVVGAADLKNFFQTHGSDTALVMLQSIMPDTVYDPLSPYSIGQRNIPREYMEKGGTIVWTHDMPFYFVGHEGKTVTTVGEKGVRRMLGVIPTTRLNRTYRVESAQSFDSGTAGYQLLGTGVKYQTGSVRFDVSGDMPPSRIQALDTELPTMIDTDGLGEHIPSYDHFEGVNRSVDVRVEAGSSLSVGFTGSDHANNLPVSLSVRFDEDGRVRSYVQQPGGGVSAADLSFVYTSGTDYTVELVEKGDWTDVYIYRTQDPKPIKPTGSVLHALWKNGTFFAEGHKGVSSLLGTRMNATWWGFSQTTRTTKPVYQIPEDQPALDGSLLTYDSNINFRNVNWSAVKNQLGNILKNDTPIVSSYDAEGRLLSLARADRTVLSYEPGADRLDAVYDLAGNLLTDYVYDAQNNLIQIINAGQRRALDEALFDAKKQVSIQKAETLMDQATEANLITQSFLDQVNTQRAQLDGQRSHYQSLLNDLEGQNMKGSSAKKQKSLTLDAYRDAIRQIDQARSQLEEEVSKQLALLSSALNEKKLSIESDFSRAFVQLEQEFTKTYVALATEEQKALSVHIWREVLGRDPTDAETASVRSQSLTPEALRSSLVQSSEQLSRKARKDSINQAVFLKLDESVNAGARAALLSSLGLSEPEAITLSTSEIQKIKTFLNSQGLHFAESAIDPLMELLKSQGQAFTEQDRTLLAARLILIDILTGQLHPFLKEGEEMMISLYAMEKTFSLYASPAASLKLTYEDLKNFSLNNPADRAVLHVEGKHYVNLIQATATEVTILDNNQIKKLSKEEFLKVWQGTTLLPEAHAPPVAVEKRISVTQAKEIKGAFFWFIPMIIGAISSITAAVGAVIAAIGAIVAAIGTIIANVVVALGQVLAGVLQGIGTLAKAVFTGLKFAGTHLFGGGLTGLFAPATQGGFFGASLNTLTATSLFKSAISIGLNYGLSRGLETLGLPIGLSNVFTGFVTGGFLGGVTSTGFDGALFLQEGLKGAVQAGSRSLLAASGLDSTAADILSILSSAPASGSSWQGTIGGQLITINPTIVQSLASYGIQKLGNSIGLDPRISGLIGIPISSAIGAGLQAGQDFTKTLIKGVQDGILSGAVGYGVTKLSSTISPASPLAAGLLSRTFTGLIDGFLNPNMSMLQGASQALTDSFANFAKSTATGDFASLVSQKGLTQALEDYAVGIFTRDALEQIVKVGGIAQVLSGSARYTQIAFGSAVVEVKEVTVGSTQLYYSAYDDKNLFGRKIGDRFERGYFGYDAQGNVVLKTGEIEVDFGNGQTTVIKIDNYTPTGYEIRSNGQPVAVSYASNGEYRLGDGLTTENGIFESKATGAKIVFKDGFADEIYIPGPEGQSLQIQGSMRDLSAEELSRLVTYLAITSNGINNPMSEGQQPLKMQALNDAIQASGGDTSRIIMPIPLYEGSQGGAGRIQDALTWLGDIIARTDLITNEMLTKIQQSFAANTALTTLGATMVLYSGAGNPGLKASQKGGLNVKSVVLIGTPLLQSVIGNPNTNTVVQIFGENDALGRLVSPPRFYKTDVYGEEVDNTFRIQIKGIGHTDYMTDNAAADPKMAKVMGELAQIVDNAHDPVALDRYLNSPTRPWYSYDSESQRYILDPDKVH